MTGATKAAESTQHLTLSVGGEEYAIPLGNVRGVIAFEGVEEIPSAPSWVRGLVRFAGVVTPVVDLASRVGLPPPRTHLFSCIVLEYLRREGFFAAIGFLVESVTGVIDLRARDIAPPPSVGGQLQVEFVRGLWTAGKKLLPVLDMDLMLSVDELKTVAALARPFDASFAPKAPSSSPLPSSTSGAKS